ncbi:MAG: sugar phosphate isomerase/epimerase family protein [Opitutaceae bacterium]|nr:sugar phosphate isomerase/epimerase family protein [Opitutaceae bacterium]
MIDSFSRRRFLKSAAVLPVAGALAVVPALAAEPPKRVGGASLKLSLNAYSFAKLLNDQLLGRGAGMSLAELAEFCAKHNFDAIDPTAYYFPGYRERKVAPDKFLFDFKRRCFELGLAISGTGTGNNFTVADKAARAKDLEWVKRTVEMAAKLGAPVVRVFADTQMRAQTWETVSNGAKRDEVEKWIADDIRACAEHGAQHGVIIGVQNHGDFIKTAADLIALLNRVDSPWCGAIVDTGYFKAADPYAEIAKAAPYAVNWQIKQSPLGVEKEAEAPTDLKRLLKIIRASGYRGYLPLETLSPRGGGGPAYDPFTVVPKFLAEVRQALVETA